MKFSVDLISKSSGRLGSLTKSDSIQLKTPLVMNYTKSGSIPYIAREVFDKLTPGQHVNEVSIENTSNMLEALKVYGKGISSFAALDPALTMLTLKDPAVSNPSFHKRKSISIVPCSGKVVVTPEVFMDHVQFYKPDLFHIMSDGETSETCAQKRLINAVERTLYFVDECIELYKKNLSLVESTCLIAPITGGYSPIYREEFIKSLNSKEVQDLIGGYFIDGFHNNGDSAMKLDEDKVESVVEKCQELLPKEKLKMMLGAYNPSMILKLIRLGVDLFDNTYAYLATTRETALTFNFNINAKSDDNVYEIKLSDTRFKDDFGPFIKNCSCLACVNHTRAYTHHLCNTKELLGPILLMIHNMHHYTEFFRAIRESIAKNNLSEMIDLIEAQKKAHDAQIAANKQTNGVEKISDEESEEDLKKSKIDA